MSIAFIICICIIIIIIVIIIIVSFLLFIVKHFVTCIE